MTDAELEKLLDSVGNRLVPVAGLLMQVACSNGRCAIEPDIHESDCECRVCKAFLTVQDIITLTDRAYQELKRRREEGEKAPEQNASSVDSGGTAT